MTPSHYRTLFALLGLLLTSAVALPLQAEATVSELDTIVSVINDDIILRSELDAEIQLISQQLAAKGTHLPPQDVLERQVLERLIAKKLQTQAAQRAGIDVDEETLSRAIKSIADNNRISVTQLRQILERDGIDYNEFRESTRDQLLQQKLRTQMVYNRIVVTDREVDNFLKKQSLSPEIRAAVHLMHILVAVPEAASATDIQAAKEKAEQLVGEIRAGASFADVAVMHSDDRNALSGGDLGWIKASEVPSIAADLVQEMEPGSVSDPIRSSSGFHILKLVEFKGGEKSLVTQTKAQHILVRTDEVVSDDEARTRLEQLRGRIQSGEDFATLARANSDDQGSAIRGGDLGWVNPGDMVPKFEQEMAALGEGQISQPFRTQFGWHIVQVEERRTRDNTEDALKTKARLAIKERKAEEAVQLWLRRLRDEAFVETRLEQQ